MPKRRKSFLFWLGIGTAAATAATWLPMPPLASDEQRPARIEAQADNQAERAQLRWASLPRREMIGAPSGEPFSPFTWTVAQLAATGSTAALSKAAVPYRIAGKVIHEAEEIVLAKGDRVITVREGDKLDDGYRVESIKADHVVLLNVPLGAREKLSLGSTFIIDETYDPDAHESRAAELRWEGPERVKAGDPFDVALKLNSTQALRAVPVQFTFDPALVQPVGVRKGALFEGGGFSYAINPAGSIWVGTSGRATFATDAEILVVTFKPLRPGGAAELNIASLQLEAADGGTLAHTDPAPFRTAIVQ
jgi:hypothetical protein